MPRSFPPICSASAAASQGPPATSLSLPDAGPFCSLFRPQVGMSTVEVWQDQEEGSTPGPGGRHKGPHVPGNPESGSRGSKRAAGTHLWMGPMSGMAELPEEAPV